MSYNDKGASPEIIPRKDMEWGREVPELATCQWEEFAKNPGYKIEDNNKTMQHNPGMNETMKEYGAGKLHSGSKKGPVVKSQKQAVAIGLSEQRRGK